MEAIRIILAVEGRKSKVERAAHQAVESRKSRVESQEFNVQQPVERYLDHDAWFRQRVRKGLDQLDRGEFLTHEEVGARIEQMFRA
ncbi:MAG: hypothetical protein DMG25_05335 [Acidobacteria bacterium]|nr:MAG: hypothetical protein DMG25_05335 [Acidobacteriota bacterium]